LISFRKLPTAGWEPAGAIIARAPGFPGAMLLAFILVQCADAWLTVIGIGRYGAAIEANPILAWYVAAFGAGIALGAAKLMAVGCAAALYVHACHRTLTALTLFYVVVAIVPWILTLHL
jgi:hypothetical protein